MSWTASILHKSTIGEDNLEQINVLISYSANK